jgi:hypothetical protein
MRHITKQGNGGFQLDRANQSPPQTSEEATSRWSSFNHKSAVLQSLLDEQYQLCCYSELNAAAYGFGFHIEHIENKNQRPERTFDYANLAASALEAQGIHALRNQQQAADVRVMVISGVRGGRKDGVSC